MWYGNAYKCGSSLQFAVMLSGQIGFAQPRRGVSNLFDAPGFGPRGKFRLSEFGLSEKPVNRPGIGIKQIKEPREL
jgi:hypothetical protein